MWGTVFREKEIVYIEAKAQGSQSCTRGPSIITLVHFWLLGAVLVYSEVKGERAHLSPTSGEGCSTKEEESLLPCSSWNHFHILSFSPQLSQNPEEINRAVL